MFHILLWIGAGRRGFFKNFGAKGCDVVLVSRTLKVIFYPLFFPFSFVIWSLYGYWFCFVFGGLVKWNDGKLEKFYVLCDGVEGWELIHTLARNLYTDLLYTPRF